MWTSDLPDSLRRILFGSNADGVYGNLIEFPVVGPCGPWADPAVVSSTGIDEVPDRHLA